MSFEGQGRVLQRTRSKSESPVKYRQREKLVDRSIRVRAVGTAFADNAAPMSAGQVEEVSQKAILMKITTRKETSSDDAHYRGQAGLIRGIRLNPTPPRQGEKRLRLAPRWETKPVTALHNVVTELNEEQEKEIFEFSCLVTLDQHSRTIRGFSRAGEDMVANPPAVYWIRNGPAEADKYGWGYGKDISVAGSIAQQSSPFTQEDRSFELVRDNFVFQERQKVGVAIFRDYDITEEMTGISGITSEEILGIYGQRDTVNVYTGEIKRVSDDGCCFEHSINTFGGCSGAIVFLLDKQPEGVGVDPSTDHGKAIAVHVGGDRIRGQMVNFAFKIEMPQEG